MNNTLTGFRIVKSEMMAGAKRAVKSGDTIYVSPAMYDLISHEEGESLQRLLENLKCIDIGKFNAFKAMESLVTNDQL